jgi:hypothetical protein
MDESLNSAHQGGHRRSVTIDYDFGGLIVYIPRTAGHLDPGYESRSSSYSSMFLIISSYLHLNQVTPPLFTAVFLNS